MPSESVASSRPGQLLELRDPRRRGRFNPLLFLPALIGMRRSIRARMAGRSGRSSRVNGVFTATIPQPMSTPTAAGMIAPLVASTVPTVAPLPKWQSGITATCLKMKPIDAVLVICCSASGSTLCGGRNRIARSFSRYI